MDKLMTPAAPAAFLAAQKTRGIVEGQFERAQPPRKLGREA
jgi:hypothetical protein